MVVFVIVVVSVEDVVGDEDVEERVVLLEVVTPSSPPSPPSSLSPLPSPDPLLSIVVEVSAIAVDVIDVSQSSAASSAPSGQSSCSSHLYFFGRQMGWFGHFHVFRPGQLSILATVAPFLQWVLLRRAGHVEAAGKRVKLAASLAALTLAPAGTTKRMFTRPLTTVADPSTAIVGVVSPGPLVVNSVVTESSRAVTMHTTSKCVTPEHHHVLTMTNIH